MLQLRVLFEPSPQVLRAKCDIQREVLGSETGGSGAPALRCHAMQVRSMVVGVMIDRNPSLIPSFQVVPSHHASLVAKSQLLQNFGAKTVACVAERLRSNSSADYASVRHVFVAM